VTDARTTVRAQDVRVGDHIFGPDGGELTVTRIDAGLLGRADLLALVEDSDVRWFKLPLLVDAEVEVRRRPDTGTPGPTRPG
jgi:hypothetical protein